MTGLEIAEKLNVDNSTISRDIKVLKEMSESFTYYLARLDSDCYYKQSLNGIEEIRGQVSNMEKRLDRIDSVIGVDSSAAASIADDNDEDNTASSDNIVDNIMKATAWTEET
jgi:hypothetical protein